MTFSLLCWFSLFLSALFPLALAAQESSSAVPWQLIWADEFDGTGLPNPARWGYETGFVRGKELQYYTRAREKNVRIKNGFLIITARKEKIRNPAYDPCSNDWRRQRPYARYTSGSITTQDRFSVRYGRIEVRARVPAGRGTWPAIWLLGTNIPEVNWPRCGEIDIMEYLGRDTGTVYGTCHWADTLTGQHRAEGKKIKITPPPSDDFHIYAIEWNPHHIDFFFDDRKYFTFDIGQAGAGPDNPFRKPFYLILNLALGGWGGKIDTSALPQHFIIDYVRIYKKTDPDPPLSLPVNTQNQHPHPRTGGAEDVL